MKYVIVALCVWFLFACQSKKESTPIEETKESINKQIIEKDTMPAAEKLIIIGKFEPKDNDSFVVIPRKYADREGLYMQKEALESYIMMLDAAANEGLTYTIKSATRNFDYQKGIWERKWTGQTILSDGVNAAKDIKDPKTRALKILEYSSMPGTSRHHWGTDIDLNSFNNEYFSSGKGLKEYNWLQANAHQYGFCQPYTSKDNGRTGYNEEKWHWSYMPISEGYTDAINSQVTYDDLKGFSGSEEAEPIDVINNYMLGIGSACK